MRKELHYFMILTIISLGMLSCGDSFLEVKPNLRQRVPHSIADYQGLLDYKNFMNRFSSHLLGILGADEFYVTDEAWINFPSGAQYHNFQRNAYQWQKTVYEGGEVNTDWTYAYQRILTTNVALDGLKKINPTPSEQADWKNAYGDALFRRSLRYYTLAQLYCKAYNPATAGKDLGLPLFLEADVTLKMPRASVAVTYQQIIADLLEALPLLPERALVVFRPSKISVLALLARIYLQMEDYEKAREYAENALSINDALLDFNTLDVNEWYPFQAYGEGNPEIIYMDLVAGTELLDNYDIYFHVDSLLINSYLPGDLRKQLLYYTEGDRDLYRGSYGGDNGFFFTGLATDEIYLVSAESALRTSLPEKALQRLNQLLKNRWAKSDFIPYNNVSKDELLSIILLERRRELSFRGLRWEDLRRLNKDPRFAKILNRKSGGLEYQLPPDDPRWVWPLPVEAIATGNYSQNER